MTSKIKRTLAILCLVTALFPAALLPVSAYGENLRFVFLADSRSNTAPTDPAKLSEAINTPVLNAIVQQILKLSPLPSFVVFGGDMAYRACFSFSNNPYYIFQTWKAVMSPLTAANVKVYTTMGNHELYVHDKDGFFIANQQEFQNVFTDNPANGPPGYEQLVYSFESPGGDAFFAVLDPYYLTADVSNPDITGTIDATQISWLTTQISQTQATHKFLFTHGPYYYVTPFTSYPPPYPPDITYTELWSILDNNRFDIYFCGHTHLYSRKTIDSTIAPQPQPNPPLLPFSPWKNNVIQVLNGTCGAPVDGGALMVDPGLWHVSDAADTYYFSVVDINGHQATVTSYRGNTGSYQPFDIFTSRPDSVPLLNLLIAE